jgi:hypothetical protein
MEDVPNGNDIRYHLDKLNDMKTGLDHRLVH